MLALEPQTHQNHDARPADASERIHPFPAVPGFREDLHVGTPIDQQGEPRANDGQRVDEDHTELPADSRR